MPIFMKFKQVREYKTLEFMAYVYTMHYVKTTHGERNSDFVGIELTAIATILKHLVCGYEVCS